MSESQTQFVVATFADENAAAGALQTLLNAKQNSGPGVLETALIRREDDGRISIKEQSDIGAGIGAAAGGLLGSLIGLLRGSTVAGAGLGAIAGGAAAHALDTGIPDARLQRIADALASGTSAVAAVMEEAALSQARVLLEASGGTVTAEPIVLPKPTFDVPNTGNKAVDDWADKAASAVAGYAGQAEKTLANLADRAQHAYEGAAATGNDNQESGKNDLPTPSAEAPKPA